MSPHYAYYPMKPKPDMCRKTTVSSTSDYNYSSWESYLEGDRNYPWLRLSESFAENFQFALLRGMAVVGIGCSYWDDLFRDVNRAERPFRELGKQYFGGKLGADWRYFAQKIAQETYTPIHYPPVCPEWLFGYGYTQRQYLSDLEVYWDNIDADYFKPWSGTRYGQDSPEIARLKKLGDVARREIDDVARHSSRYIKP